MIKESYVESVGTNFAMWCDENGLTLSQGRELAEAISENLIGIAEHRSHYLPKEYIDDE